MAHDPRPLAEILQTLLQDQARPPDQPTQAGDDPTQLLFLGNPQDPCPRLLLLDSRLEPVDIVTWQVIRIHAAPGKVVTFPSYTELMRWVRVSRATIARALSLLRLTRWLLLVAAPRDRNGRFAGNVYALLDESLPLPEMLRLDEHYFGFAEHACEHRNAHVRHVAAGVLDEAKRLAASPDAASLAPVSLGRHLDTRFARIRELMAPRQPEQSPVSQESNAATERARRVQNLNPADRVQNLNAASCSSSTYKKTTTTLGDVRSSGPESPKYRFPTELRLTDSQRRVLALRLAALEPTTAQDVLDEATARILAKRLTPDPVRCEFDYIARLCSLALAGEFTFTDAGTRFRRRRREQP